MKIRENIVIVTDIEIYENCSNINFEYENGKAVSINFTFNKGSAGTSIEPSSIKDCFDKDSKLNFLKELKSFFVMPESTETLSVNQDILRDEIKRYLLEQK